MTPSLEQIRNQLGSQLDLTLRIVQISGSYAEKIVAVHFAMLQGLLQKTSVPEVISTEQPWQSLSEQGNVLCAYWKSCMHEKMEYQKRLLSELSRE